ncbi:hypothetical protein Deba_0759 [Desulfarculus baarsii DSM 2075]|uniref:Uncharacterized protein n=1 Tax=Desulfarculus baarsii (strain ATCC 33931 / DSM 2075 / LMG 7858 / VKM B-1802 / 2st14) TaxID=644282 RepID=E1QEZ5_DESB2|nr:hypothetical protein [Desulfarculus baarsii]ADK84131.1 hypothetical protein Deba_0759 [Desulfarculus baarsii DSM 2075]
MPAEVTAISGRACAYYLAGRCARTRSQAESAAAFCPMMQARGKLGAQTRDRLNRLDRLADPNDREVARRHIMQKTAEAIGALKCPDFVPDVHGQICIHQHLIYCQLLLPPCPGRCEDFLPRAKPGPRAQP